MSESEYRSSFTGFLNDAAGHYDPWQHLSIPELFPEVRVHFSTELPFGVWAFTHFAARSIALAAGMNAAETRATLAHEIVHLERGFPDEADSAFEEKICDLVAASRLISCADLNGLGGRVSDMGAKAAAAELGVDEMTIEIGLSLEACIQAMINGEVGSEEMDRPSGAKAARA